MLPLLPFFKQIFHLASAVYGSRNKGLQRLARKIFFNQKRNEFLKIIIW